MKVGESVRRTAIYTLAPRAACQGKGVLDWSDRSDWSDWGRTLARGAAIYTLARGIARYGKSA